MNAMQMPIPATMNRCSAQAPGIPVPIGDLVAAILERVQFADGPNSTDPRPALHRRTATA